MVAWGSTLIRHGSMFDKPIQSKLLSGPGSIICGISLIEIECSSFEGSIPEDQSLVSFIFPWLIDTDEIDFRTAFS